MLPVVVHGDVAGGVDGRADPRQPQPAAQDDGAQLTQGQKTHTYQSPQIESDGPALMPYTHVLTNPGAIVCPKSRRRAHVSESHLAAMSTFVLLCAECDGGAAERVPPPAEAHLGRQRPLPAPLGPAHGPPLPEVF